MSLTYEEQQHRKMAKLRAIKAIKKLKGQPVEKPTTYFPTCKCGMAVVALLQEASGSDKQIPSQKWMDDSFYQIFEPLIKGVELACPSINFHQLNETTKKAIDTSPNAIFKPIAGQLMENFRECHPNQRTGTVEQELQQSIGEEEEAIHNYSKRTVNADKEGDYEASALFNHIRSEERRHLRELQIKTVPRQSLGEVSPAPRLVKDASPEEARALYKKITGKEID